MSVKRYGFTHKHQKNVLNSLKGICLLKKKERQESCHRLSILGIRTGDMQRSYWGSGCGGVSSACAVGINSACFCLVILSLFSFSLSTFLSGPSSPSQQISGRADGRTEGWSYSEKEMTERLNSRQCWLFSALNVKLKKCIDLNELSRFRKGRLLLWSREREREL